MSRGSWLAFVAILASSAGARADEPSSADERSSIAPLLPVRIGGHASLTWEGEMGVGGRVDIPLLDDGIMFGSRDELSISAGLDLVFVAFEGTDPLTFWPTGTVQWTLGLTPKFSF